MPEIPDLELYVAALRRRLIGQRLERVRLLSPFFLRTVDPPLSAFEGATVTGIGRLAKRIAIAFDDERYLIVHLMIAGRLHWVGEGPRRGRPKPLAEIDFTSGTLLVTEAGSTRRASLSAVRGTAALAAHTPPGVDVLACTVGEFVAALTRENRTLKRALTDQRIVTGIGNAYSDEILHRARLSPLMLTSRASPAQLARAPTRSRAPPSRSGSIGCRSRAAMRSPRRSPRSGPTWPCTDGSASRVPSATHRFNALSTLPTNATTARVARPADVASRIGRCPACSAKTGRARWTRLESRVPVFSLQ